MARVCFSIPENISGEILKAVQSIYPMQNVYIRKVKALKKPKFDRECYGTLVKRRVGRADTFLLITVTTPFLLLSVITERQNTYRSPRPGELSTFCGPALTAPRISVFAMCCCGYLRA